MIIIFLHGSVYPIQLGCNQLRVANYPHIRPLAAVTNLEESRDGAMVLFDHIRVARNSTTVRTLMMRVLTKVAAGS